MKSSHFYCKRFFSVIAAGVMLFASVYAVSAHASGNIPSIQMSYIFTTHHTPLMVAAALGEELKPSGAYLVPMVPKQKYRLMNAQGRPMAVINLIVSKSGSETATLFAMNQVDVGLASSTAFISGVDKGTPVKILFPLHVDGMSMVFPPDVTIKGYEEVAKAIRASDTPFKIGYHSPTSAPRVVFEGALHKAGFSITGNANDASADILMVDLKSTSNLIPSLHSGTVDCWVGPAPHPAVAEHKKVGHIGLDSRELPPAGEWTDFPCCVLGARDQVISDHPAILQALANVMTASADWCNKNKRNTADISAQWLGVPAEAVEKSAIIYTTKVTENWMNGIGLFIDMLNSMNKFNGRMKDADLQTAAPILFDLSFTEKALAGKSI
jgi:NitT/TauT family transport system substrate-binding protein